MSEESLNITDRSSDVIKQDDVPVELFAPISCQKFRANAIFAHAQFTGEASSPWQRVQYTE